MPTAPAPARTTIYGDLLEEDDDSAPNALAPAAPSGPATTIYGDPLEDDAGNPMDAAAAPRTTIYGDLLEDDGGAPEVYLPPPTAPLLTDRAELARGPASTSTTQGGTVGMGGARMAEELLNVPRAAARGLLPEGAGAALEGGARMAGEALNTARGEVAAGTPEARLDAERAGLQRRIRAIEGTGSDAGGGGYGNAYLSPEDEAELQQANARILAIDQERDGRRFSSAPVRFADAVADVRQDYRDALPLDPQFEQSLLGQVASGVGQAGFTLPTLVVPGLGPSTMVAQLYSAGYDDAVSSGADAATAAQAGLANVPAAALEYLGDKLLLGRVLHAAKGQATVGQFARSLAGSAATGGLTEGAQEGWQNVVARHLVGYDPDRPLDEGVVNAILVGALTDTVVTGGAAAAPYLVRGGVEATARTARAAADGMAAMADRLQPEGIDIDLPEGVTLPDTIPAGTTPPIIDPANPAASPPARAPVHPDQWRNLARADRLGALAGLSDEQLADLAGQIGAQPAPVATPPTPTPTSPTPTLTEFGDPIDPPDDAPAETPASFEELARLWSEVGVTLKFTELPNGDTELTVLRVPEDQRGQGVGSIVLQEIKDVAEVLRKPVQLLPTPLDVRITGNTEQEVEASTATYTAARDRLAAWYARQGFTRTGRGSRLVRTREGSEVRERDPVYRYVPGTVAGGVVKTGVRPRYGSRPDGVEDLLDDIQSLRGVPRPPADPAEAAGGEWNGWASAFGDAASRLLVHPRRAGRIDAFIEELNLTGRYRFETADDFYDAVGVAIEQRRRAKAKFEREQNQEQFYTTALSGKGRRDGRKPGPSVPVATLGGGDTFQVAGERFEVTDIDPDTGDVTAQDGPRFGTVELPADARLHPDAGTLKQTSMQDRARDFSFGEESGVESRPNGFTANAMPSKGTTPKRNRMHLRDLPRDMREELFGLHATSVNPEATERAFHAMSVPAGVLELGSVQVDEIPNAQLHRYINADPSKMPPVVIADGRLIDGQHRIAAARARGVSQLSAIDLTGVIDSESTGFVSDLPPGAFISFAPRPRPSGTANATPGAASAQAYPGPDAFAPQQPADNPAFSQFAIELPELVQLAKALMKGQYPKIRERLRVLGGNALGVFYHRDGPEGEGRIELRADIFRLVSDAEKGRLLTEARRRAAEHIRQGSQVPIEELTAEIFNLLVREREQAALSENPRQALAVLAHEYWHLVDWLPDKTLARGNLAGHVAAFKRYFKAFVAERPGMDPEPETPTRAEQAKLRRQAEKELSATVTEIVETIRREEPEYRELPVTAADITSILKTAQRDEFPGLYDWFAGLDRATKAAVLRAAMKGAVDPRAAPFRRREATGRTVTVEEKRTTRANGPAATPEQIRARFAELLRAELRKRGLVSEQELRAEAAEVIKWWQGVPEVPAYFKTATETFAEVGSAFINNPAGVAKRAPLLYKLIMAHMDSRPEFAESYRAMQDAIRSGAVHRERVLNLRDMWHRDEDASMLAESMWQKVSAPAVRDTLSLLLNRHTAPIQRRALAVLAGNKGDRMAANVLRGLKNYLYRATGYETYARAVSLRVEAPLAAANLSHDDMSEMLFHSRIAKGDRQQMANPLGWSPKTSAERLAAMQSELGPQRWAALEQASAEFRAIYEEQIVALLKESRILTPELEKIIVERNFYATFAKAREFNPLDADTLVGALENRYGKDVSARIYRQIGTLGEVRSPYLATMQKALSLITTARRQIALKSIVQFLEKHEPQNIIPADTRFVQDSAGGGRMEPVPVDTAQVGTLYTLDRGKVKAYYVPRAIYETMAYGSPMESWFIGGLHKVLSWPKAILTELNPGFWPIALYKDVQTAMVQIPGGMKGVPKYFASSWGAARASMTGKPSALADMALRRQMWISRADNRGEKMWGGDEMGRMLLRMNQNPRLIDGEAKKIGRFLRFWHAWKRQGQMLERTVKLASLQTLDEAFPDMPEWEKQRLVLERGGSPDFLEKGRIAPLADLVFLFYNPWLRGLEATKDAAKSNPAGITIKYFATIGLAAGAYWMFEKGLLGLAGADPEDEEDIRNMMRAIPEREKRRGYALPLGWSDKEQGKVAYIVLPFPDSFRYVHATQRALLQLSEEDRPANVTLRDYLAAQGGDLPGGNPVLKEASAWWTYHVEGRNPYDPFLGRERLPEDMVTARQGGTELALQSFSNVTGGLIYRHRPDRPGETPTSLEQFLQTPLAGNIVGRWVRVSSRGFDEEADRAMAPTREQEAELRLVATEMVQRTFAAEPWSESQQTLFVDQPYVAEQVTRKMEAIIKRATVPELRAWERAKSTGERIALLESWARRDEQAAERLRK